MAIAVVAVPATIAAAVASMCMWFFYCQAPAAPRDHVQ